MNHYKPICGVSFGPYYLDKNSYSVSLLTVTKNKAQKWIWYVTEILYVTSNVHGAECAARKLAEHYGTDAYYGIRKGLPVAKTTIKKLKQQGIIT